MKLKLDYRDFEAEVDFLQSHTPGAISPNPGPEEWMFSITLKIKDPLKTLPDIDEKEVIKAAKSFLKDWIKKEHLVADKKVTEKEIEKWKKESEKLGKPRSSKIYP